MYIKKQITFEISSDNESYNIIWLSSVTIVKRMQ